MHRWLPILAILILCSSVAVGQEFPEPPERYPALNPWFEGEILELREDAGVIRLKTVRMVSEFEELIVGDPERAAWIELRYAKGWVYFDEEDGSQSRRNLREGRQRLRVGQIIAIGREPSQGGGWEGGSIKLTGGGRLAGGSQVRLRGWILVRVTPFRDTERPRRP